MNQSASPTPLLPQSTAPSRTWLKGIAKRVILNQLQQLHTGLLILQDGDQTYHFGDSESELIAEMHINDDASYVSLMSGGSIGAAEAYMTNDWETPDLTSVVRLMALNMDVLNKMEGGLRGLMSKPFLKIFHKLNDNTEKGSRRNIAAHYDLGNDLFEQFLDPKMMYSSAIFESEQSTLDEAAEYKLKCICDALQLTEQDRIVEIGTGWGGFAIYAATNYGCHVTTTTISNEQFSLASSRIQEAGLADKITLLKQDYRDLSGKFDKLVSIEMIEAVGWKYYDTFFKTCGRLLKPDGVMLIQAITIEDQRYESAKRDVDFIQRYIFPGSCIPSIQALLTASSRSSDMRLSFQRDYADHYARTLAEWQRRFNASRNEILALGYSEEFIRLWQFYFSYCEGGFKERSIGVSHLVFSKPRYRSETT